MEIQEGLKIMRALADGLSPETGEVLSADLVTSMPQRLEPFTAQWGHWKLWRSGNALADAGDQCRQIVVAG
jgi:hypothetical protein